MDRQPGNASWDRRQALGGMAALGMGAALAGPSAFAAAGNHAALRAALAKPVDRGLLPGTMGGVGVGSAQPDVVGVGYVDFDDRRVPDAHSLWRIYSMSKVIVGIAGMVLVGEGKIRLDQPVADILPAFANPMVLVDPKGGTDVRPAKTVMTISQCMTHSTGHGGLNARGGEMPGGLALNMSRPGSIAGERGGAPGGLARFIDDVAKRPLAFDPGTSWSYTVGLDILARAIEVVAGEPIEVFLREKLFGPLGMRDTFFTVPAKRAADLVTMVTIEKGKASPMDVGKTSAWLTPPAYPSSSGGLVSSVHDYHRFLAMLANEGTLGRARVMAPETARLAMSDLLAPQIDRKLIVVPGCVGFGAGGALGGLGRSRDCFGWFGAAGTIAWVDRPLKMHATAWAQFLPPTAFLMQGDVVNGVYADAKAANGA